MVAAESQAKIFILGPFGTAWVNLCTMAPKGLAKNSNLLSVYMQIC